MHVTDFVQLAASRIKYNNTETCVGICKMIAQVWETILSAGGKRYNMVIWQTGLQDASLFVPTAFHQV